MNCVKITISLSDDTRRRVDDLVACNVFPSRSRAIQIAVSEKLARLDRSRLATECAKLDLRAERALADRGMGCEVGTWPN